MERKKAIPPEINRTSRMIRRCVDKIIHDILGDEITSTQSRVIGYIFVNGDKDVFQRDIEKEFNIRRSTATNMLKLLEKNGLIERAGVESDARLKKIILTQKAIEEQKKICQCFDRIDEVLQKGISEEQRDSFFEVLEIINKNIKEAEADDKKISSLYS